MLHNLEVIIDPRLIFKSQLSQRRTADRSNSSKFLQQVLETCPLQIAFIETKVPELSPPRHWDQTLFPWRGCQLGLHKWMQGFGTVLVHCCHTRLGTLAC